MYNLKTVFFLQFKLLTVQFKTVYCTKCIFNGVMLSAANKSQRETDCGFHKPH